ncbi:uncharacterized protein C9orf50 homolog isoform X3 [Cavia porcellus]|uniref:uncharacterized protein C9orf50 homolog isoform X3 n=1 Tax=Cavia porcellus TaxID=10141 RepID=UPI002FE17093
MFLRPLRPGAHMVAPDRCPRATGDFRRRAPQLFQLGQPELWAARGAGGPGISRVLGGSSSWWQERDVGLGVGVRSPSPPVLSTGTRRAKCHVLPPLFSPPEPWASSPRRPWPGEPEAVHRGLDRETPDPVGVLLGELLPCKFREFLSHLRAKCAEELPAETPMPSATPTPRQSPVSEPWRDSARQCPSCQFLPDLRDQLSDFQERLEKILHHQKSTLGPLRGDHSELPTVRKPSLFCGAPGPEARSNPNPSGEGLGPRRRSCPYRVRFADESFTDSALRYLERHCTAQNRPATPPAESVSRPGFQSFGRWQDGLPKAEYSWAREDTTASSPCWAQPGLATTTRPWRNLQGLLDTRSFLEQMDRSPYSWSHKPVSTDSSWSRAFLPRGLAGAQLWGLVEATVPQS